METRSKRRAQDKRKNNKDNKIHLLQSYAPVEKQMQVI